MAADVADVLAVAIGGAVGWRDELEAVEAVRTPDLYVACNDAGVVLPALDHWVSLHPGKLIRENRDHPKHWSWVRQRAEAGLPAEYVTWGHGEEPYPDRILNGWADGSSGLLAVGVALHVAPVGAPVVVCCGIRQDREPNAFRGGKAWNDGEKHRDAWTGKMDILRGRVFSMSGWTRRQFGAPPFIEASTEPAYTHR